VVVVGDQMPASSRHKDWVLVHELFHLGFPTFRGEGRWLGEGLATYYEPILRARAGWTTESEVFRQFARNMPRGQAPRGSSAGLSARDDLDTIYWGGAMFCLAADVRIREETRGRHSLDDVIRGALDRGGDATHVWTVRDVVTLGDRVTGTNVLSEMYERYAARGERIDLDGLLDSLGVPADGREANDQRPLAWIRRGIVDGTSRETLARSP
jgi:predicted metalloprotease with PDZ domain